MDTMKEVILLGYKGWPQMQCDKPKAKDGGGVHNIVKKTCEVNYKKMIIGWIDVHIPTLGPTQNCKCAQWKYIKKKKWC